MLMLGDIEEAEQNLWWVPLGLKLETTPQGQLIDVLDKQKHIIISPLDLTFYKLNDSASGVFRVKYPSKRLEMLGKEIANGHTLLNASDRISLIADAAALSVSGTSSTTEFLSFIENFKHESNFFVWDELLKCLSQLRSAWYEQSEAAMNGLRAFSEALISPKLAEIGWQASPGEDYLTSQLRPLLINEAHFAKMPGYIDLLSC